MHKYSHSSTSNEFILRRTTSANWFLVKSIISLVSYIQLAKISARVQNSRYQNAISRDPIRKMQRCGVRSIALYRRSFDDNTCISIGMLMKRTFFSWIGYLCIFLVKLIFEHHLISSERSYRFVSVTLIQLVTDREKREIGHWFSIWKR